MSDDGSSELDAMIARVRSVRGLAEKIAPDIADAVKRELQRTAEAGTSPSGQPWAPTLEGKRPLRNAASHIAAIPTKGAVYIKIRGADARHHLKRARGSKPDRYVLPAPGEGLPGHIHEKMVEVVGQHFTALVKGSDQ